MDLGKKSGLKGLLGVGVFTVYSFSWGADDSSRRNTWVSVLGLEETAEALRCFGKEMLERLS